MLAKRRLSHARGYLALGMAAEAAEELAQLSGPDADSTECLSLKTAVAHEQENWSTVRALARELIRREEADAGVWISLAYATRRVDSLIAAEMILIKAEKMFPQEATIQFNLGCYACQRGDLTTARRRVIRAVELDAAFRLIAMTDVDLAPLRAAFPEGFLPAA